MEDDDNTRPAPNTVTLGGDLSDMSVEEISELIDALKAEIERLEQAARSKSDHLSAAAALFKS